MNQHDFDYSEFKKIWESILGSPVLDDESDFFSMGGHSLIAIDLLEQIECRYLVRLSFKDLIENPTPRSLFQILINTEKSENIKTYNFDNSKIFEASVAQKHLWTLVKLYPHSLNQNISTAIRLKINVDKNVINKVVNYLFNEHQVLKCHFVKKDNVLHQEIQDIGLVDVPLEIISEDELISRLDHEMSYEFSLEGELLFRIKLFKISDDDYVFFFLAHHIVWDGISNMIYFNHFMKHYFSLASGGEFLDLTSKSTYFEFVHDQLEFIKTESYSKQLQFWKDSFDKFSTKFLERDKSDNVHSTKSNVQRFHIKGETLDLMQRYVKSKSISLYKFLISVHSFNLYKLTQSSNVVIGSPVHGRSNRKFRDAVGYFINTLPLTFKLNNKSSFSDNIKQNSQQINKCFFNQDIPLDHILKHTNAGKVVQDGSLFQSLFVYLDFTKDLENFQNIDYEIMELERKSSHCEIDFYFYKKEEEVEVIIEYKESLFTKDYIKNYFKEYMNLAALIIENDEKPLESILPKENKARKVLLLENYEKNYNLNCSFIEMIDENIKKYPKKLAVISDDFKITFEELDREINKIASCLLENNVKNKDVVGVYLDRNKNLVPALIAILKSGATYLPLDANFPEDRLQYMLEVSECKIVLCESTSKITFNNCSNVNLDKVIDNRFKKIEYPHLDTNQSAYILFTSGSTGKPKGVEVSLKNMTNFLLSMKEKPGISEVDKFLSVTTISFDISVLELFLPLIVGATQYLCKYKQLISPESLKEVILSNEITMMQATPVTWRMLLGYDKTSYKNLKVLCGGESLDVILAENLISRTKEVWNMYGPTETTVWSSVKKVTDHLNITIGVPIANTEFLILSDNMEALPIGDVGELYIGGEGVSKGYIKRPDLTSERFISHPFKENQIIYKTGDLAFYNSQGEILCLGRSDDQIKLRGYRIELKEIESVLLSHDTVFEAAAKVINQELYAFISLKSTSNNLYDQAGIDNLLKKSLPSYMKPRSILVLNSLPKTLNGKIDKKILELPKDYKDLNQIEDKASIDDYISPVIVNLVKNIWMKNLNLIKVSLNENFFNLGGHSLIALEIFDEVNDYFNINLDISKIFENDTILAMSRMIQREIDEVNKDTKDLPNIVLIKKRPNRNNLFCFHGVGGNVLNYYPLSKVTQDYTFYGIQSIGLDGSDLKFYSLKEMASIYISQIRKIQPKGPYLLAGGSMGGLIAFEVASQLKQLGENVESVVMFDTFGPALRIEDDHTTSRNKIVKTINHLKFLKNYYLLSLKIKSHKIRKKTLPQQLRYGLIELKNMNAIRNYKASEVDINVSLIRAPQALGGVYVDPHLGWKKYVKGSFDTVEIDGSHDTFIESKAFLNTFKKILNDKKIS